VGVGRFYDQRLDGGKTHSKNILPRTPLHIHKQEQRLPALQTTANTLPSLSVRACWSEIPNLPSFWAILLSLKGMVQSHPLDHFREYALTLPSNLCIYTYTNRYRQHQTW
jgi:hypothetical protein